MAFPIFFRTMTPFRGSSPRMTPAPSSNIVETAETAPGIAPTTPTVETTSSATALVPSQSSASASASASPLRSMVEHAADHAVIFISTFLFGDDAWGNAAATATASTKSAQPANAAHPRDDATTVRLSHHHRSHPRRPRGVKPFAPTLPTIGEDSATIDVDEAELQRVRAARLTRFELRMLARSSFDDDDEEDDDSDSYDERDQDDEAAADEGEQEEVDDAIVDDEDETNQSTASDNLEVEELVAPVEVVEYVYSEDGVGHPEEQLEEAEEEKEKEEVIVNDNNDSMVSEPLINDESESESESEHEDAKMVACGDSDDAAACAGEQEGVAGHRASSGLSVTSEADVLVQEDLVVVDLDQLDHFEEEAGEDEIYTRICDAAATKIQRLARHWMNANTPRSIHDALYTEIETEDEDDDDDVEGEDMKDDAVSVTSSSSTSTSTSSSEPNSPSSGRYSVPSYSHAKPVVDSNNSDKRTRQYALSPATLLRRAAQAQRRADIKRGTEALEERVRNARAKVDSHRPRPRPRPRTKPSSEQQ